MGLRRRYQRLAPLYDAIDLAEVTYKRRLRPLLFAGLRGRILDAGAGTGRNIPFYPEGATVVGIDISPAMLARARDRCERLDKRATLAAMDVLGTAFPDRSFDAVVAAFLFGVLDDGVQAAALAELARVCRPEGEIRILDYTYARHPLRRLLMALWLPWQKLVYGGAFDRRTERHMPEAGLTLVREELVYADMVRLLVAKPAPARASAGAPLGS